MSICQKIMVTDNDRIARYGNLVIYEKSGVLMAEWTIQGSDDTHSLSKNV